MRQWIVGGAMAVAAYASTGCSNKDTPSAPPGPGPARSVSVMLVKSAMVAGTAQQLTTAVVDKDGKPVTTATLTWTATPATVATITSAGLLSALAPGTVRVTASVGSIVGTADVQVDDDPCTKPVAMRVGEVRSFSGGSTVSCITIASSTGASDYLFIGANTRPIQDDLLQYSISLGVSPATAINSSVAPADLDPRPLLERQSMEQVDALHERLRAFEHKESVRCCAPARSGGARVPAWAAWPSRSPRRRWPWATRLRFASRT